MAVIFCETSKPTKWDIMIEPPDGASHRATPPGSRHIEGSGTHRNYRMSIHLSFTMARQSIHDG